ncbi:MAG: type II toxin-antitoxin system RelE/ParE family toxin [Bacteroidetes bacterium]|nr:type II toxin-antitoxin system RelE/ParE family toxin [Bacteroidota bacterium]
MIVKIDKSLEKDISKITDQIILKKLHPIIIAIQKSSKLSEIKNLKKLRGSKNIYRIRIGNFRLGIVYQNKTIEIIRLLHRKDIYRYFP